MNHLSAPELLLSLRQSLSLALTISVVLMGTYVVFEPSVTHSQVSSTLVSDQFTISQTITSEITFAATAADVTMSASIPGITGGVANGSTQVRILTNDAAGYTMTISASGTPAMQGNTQGGSIPDYTPGTAGIPDYVHAVAANTAEFAYTVSASTTGDLALKFRDSGSACNTGSSDTGGFASCWYGLSSTATSTITRSSWTAVSGSTSTIFFRTLVNSNPNPTIPEDIYVATTTLTATVN